MFFRRVRADIISYFTLLLLVLVSTCVLWLPFLLKAEQFLGIPIPESNFGYIYRHFDGLLYIIVSKSLYNIEAIQALHAELTLPPSYFAAHFPLYPFLVRVFAPALGYLKSMIAVNIAATIILSWLFYYVLKSLKLTAKPLLLTAVFLFFPRFLVVRSVGAPESLFILFVLASIFFFEKKNYLGAGIFGALSVFTRSPGMLLFPAYAVVFVEEFLRSRKVAFSWAWILLIPAGLLGVFILYAVQYGDVFAYFKSGDNFHLAYPFAVFNYSARWVGTAWLEEAFFYFFIFAAAIIKLKDSPYRSFFYFPLIYFIAITLVQHQDIGRYALPLWPFTAIAFEGFLTSPKYRPVLMLLLVAVYFYAWNFMVYNVMPVSDWSAYL